MNFAPNWTSRELFSIALTCAPDPVLMLVEGAAYAGSIYCNASCGW